MTARPFFFTVPESFDAREFLRTPELCRRADDARYFISLILRKLAQQHADRHGWVRLQATHLRSVMEFHRYHAVIDALLEGGAVVRAPYKKGVESFGYQLAERFEDDKHVRVAATDPRLIDRLKAHHEQAAVESRSRMKPVHHALAKQQHRLSIHGDEAREVLSGLPPRCNRNDVQGILIADIENCQFHLNVGQYGRVSNNISSLKRELRDSLHVNGLPLCNVDLSCAQPGFTAKLIREDTAQHHVQQDQPIKDRRTNQRQQERTTETNQEQEGNRERQPVREYDVQNLQSSVHYRAADLALFEDLVQTGELYRYLLYELQNVGIIYSREKLKRTFLCDVLAKKKVRTRDGRGVEYRSEVENMFRRLFPTVYRFIREFNGDGWEHENLIRELQRQESAFVIETVAADLVKRYPNTFFITLHDAIFSAERDIPKVLAAFEAGFDLIDFWLNLKVSPMHLKAAS